MPYKDKDKQRAYHSAYHAKWYEKNKTEQKQKANARRIEIAAWFLEYKKALACSQCGFKHPAAIDFHHVGDDKEAGLAQMVHNAVGKKRILKEIAKCEILCSNCHRILHYDERHP